MTVIRRLLGWTSWLIVAAWVYGVLWTHLDDSLVLAFSAEFYRWIGDALGVYTHDEFYYMVVWVTSIIMILALHVIAWIVVGCLRLAFGVRGTARLVLLANVLPVVGWCCWLLVVTFAMLVVGEDIFRAGEGKRYNHLDSHLFKYVVSVCMVGLLHLAGLQLVRLRRRRVQCRL